MALRNPTYWKDHYVVETDADEVARGLTTPSFASAGREFELVAFERGPAYLNLLVSQGSGGHAYVFAELAYLLRRHGYNVFVMPRHGGHTIAELVTRHADALSQIARRCNDRIGVYAEGLGGFAAFYLALDRGPLRSIALQDAPAILTEAKFHAAPLEDERRGAWRRILLPLATRLAKAFPGIRLPISSYLDFNTPIDAAGASREVETRLVKEGYRRDPDVDRWYPLPAILSPVSTPPPRPLAALAVPTLLVVARRGFASPAYFRDRYDRLPAIRKALVEGDGGVFWMLSHPREAAALACGWFDETV